MTDTDITRYEGQPFERIDLKEFMRGIDRMDVVLISDGFARLGNYIINCHSELDRLQAEVERLTALIPTWTTVTDDPATWPDTDMQVLVDCSDYKVGPVTAYRFQGAWLASKSNEQANYTIGRVQLGDRWRPIPTDTTQTGEAQ